MFTDKEKLVQLQEHFSSLLQPEQAQKMTDDQLLDDLSSFGIKVDRTSLAAHCEEALSADEVMKKLTKEVKFSDEQENQTDRVWMCLHELCQRWCPGKLPLDNVNFKFQEGYDAWQTDAEETCRLWTEAWSSVLQVLEKTGIESASAFDQKAGGLDTLSDWVQDFAEVMGEVAGQAGDAKPDLLNNRITICEEILKRIKFGKEQSVVNQELRNAIAQSHAALGEPSAADEPHQAKPGASVNKPTRKAIAAQRAELIKQLFTQVVQKNMGTGKQPGENVGPKAGAAVKSASKKVGANDSCPCNSGKKYKKCCGRGAWLF